MDKSILKTFSELKLQLLHIYDSNNIQETQEFIVVSKFDFPSLSNPISHIEVVGKNVSDIILSAENFIKNMRDIRVLDTRLDNINIETFKFSKNFTWAWYS